MKKKKEIIMDNQEMQIQLFKNQKIRSIWNPQKQDYYYSVVDVVRILTESETPRRYWAELKNKLKEEGSQLFGKIEQLKMEAEDGKMRLTDVLDTEGVFRLIQSIPSKKAEPFKEWLAKVGKERLEEMANPSKAFERVYQDYKRKGYSDKWINLRLKSIESRREITDEWQRCGITKNKDYAILTDEMLSTWSGMKTKEYKKYKDLNKKENLKDNMTKIELALDSIAELTATELSKQKNPYGLSENKTIARAGGEVAYNTRKDIENKLGRSVVTPENARSLNALSINQNKKMIK